jgi:hypothetical protein
MRETATGSPAGTGSGSADHYVSGHPPGEDETTAVADAVDTTDEESRAGLGTGGVGTTGRDEATTQHVTGGAGTRLDGQVNLEPAAFSRPPGMVPPPDHADERADDHPEPGMVPPVGAAFPPVPLASPAYGSTGSFPSATATAPVSGPPRNLSLATSPGGLQVRPPDPAVAVGSARVQEVVRPARVSSGPRGPRRARLSVKRLDPWSVMKFSFAVSLVLFIVMIVAASVLYLALDSMGVFASVNNTLADLVESGGGAGDGFRITASGVIGTAAFIGAINVVLFTALATLGAFIYNVCADLVGGVEVTLAERD